MASMSNPVQQLLNAEKKAAIVVNDARTRKYEDIHMSVNQFSWLMWSFRDRQVEDCFPCHCQTEEFTLKDYKFVTHLCQCAHSSRCRFWLFLHHNRLFLDQLNLYFFEENVSCSLSKTTSFVYSLLRLICRFLSHILQALIFAGSCPKVAWGRNSTCFNLL